MAEDKSFAWRSKGVKSISAPSVEIEAVSKELFERSQLLSEVEMELAELEAQLKKLNNGKALRRGDAQAVGTIAAYYSRIKAQINVAQHKRKQLLEDVMRAEERKIMLIQENDN